jgi:predicted RNA-binding Zn-ribbon protein involved in translation (DUF1610 family)
MSVIEKNALANSTVCAACGNKVDMGETVCPNCGAAMAAQVEEAAKKKRRHRLSKTPARLYGGVISCPTCGEEVPDTDENCPNCGASMPASSGDPAPAAPAGGGDTGGGGAAASTEGENMAAETTLDPGDVTVTVDGEEVPAELGTRPDDAEAGEQLATVIVVDESDDDDAGTDVACPECGAVNDGDAKCCDQCGCDMPGMDAEDQSEPPETPGEAPDAEDQAEGPEMNVLPTWEGELAYQGMATSDGRVLMAGQITHRDLPLTLMFQYITAEGHMGAEACGKITQIWEDPRPDMGDGVVAIMGSGEFSTDMMGPTAAASLSDEIVRHVSVDIAPNSRVVLDANTLQEIPSDELDYDSVLNGSYLVGIGGEIMGATIVPFSAFADAKLRAVPAGDVVLASAWVDVQEVDAKVLTVFTSNASFKLVPRSITASAAGLAPIAPPRDWFFSPEPEGKFPLTVMDDGRIMGHLATWDQCHHGFLNECVLAQPSRTSYSFFHVGQIMTAEGEYVDVGRIVVGENVGSGHASVQYRLAEATRHYDKTALVGAFVRAVDGKYGIWLSGVVRSDCPAERVRDMLANPPSGDWRAENGHLELIAALSVPVPGFPVPRYEYALTASAEDAEVQTLIATGYFELDPPSFSRAEMRKREVLINQARKIAQG